MATKSQRGQITQRGPNTWQVRIPLGRDATGTRKFHTTTVKGTRKDAELERTKLLRELDTKTLPTAGKQTVGEFLQQWLEVSVKPSVRTRTSNDYEYRVTKYINPALGTVKLAKLDAPRIQKLYADMLERELSPRSVGWVHQVLHRALEQAVRWNLIAVNPAKLVDRPKQERKEKQVLTPEQAARLLEAAEHDRQPAFWTLMLYGGMRPSEAVALKWSDLNGDQLRIQRTLVRPKGGGWNLLEPKTNRGRRTISLTATELDALKRQRKMQAEWRLAAGPRWEDHDLIFTTPAGGPLMVSVLSKRNFKTILEHAELPDMRLYDLRHSCASLLLAAGVNAKVVSERLGHSSVAFTMDVYSHVLPGMQKDASAKLAALIGQGRERATGTDS